MIESRNPICFCTDFYQNFYCHWFCSMILINIRIPKGCIKLWRICSFRKENAICFILLWVIINKLLSTKHSQSVRNFSLRTSSILWITLSEKNTYHQHKDKKHFIITIEEGQKYVSQKQEWSQYRPLKNTTF